MIDCLYERGWSILIIDTDHILKIDDELVLVALPLSEARKRTEQNAQALAQILVKLLTIDAPPSVVDQWKKEAFNALIFSPIVLMAAAKREAAAEILKNWAWQNVVKDKIRQYIYHAKIESLSLHLRMKD